MSKQPSPEEIAEFERLIEENRFDLVTLLYLIFPFGEPSTEDNPNELEFEKPYDWQIEELMKLSAWLQNPLTRYQTYQLIISSGNGAAKTAFGAMVFFIMMYTHKVRCRITANTDPQLKSVVWPEYDVWYRRARYSEFFFEKLGTSIKARDSKLSETWRGDLFNWSENSPASISGLHNKGHATMYIFEEAPGIPGNIWNYATGAFTEQNTIKLFFAFGNSDDPVSKFELNMASPDWNSRRIDTRTLDHIDKNQIQLWLRECNGDEDHDDFRVRVRGLPRKSSKDSIIALENVIKAFERRKNFDLRTVRNLPLYLTCDPAWKGGDETVIVYRQGNYCKILERYKLDKETEDHSKTYYKLVEWEKILGADIVIIDQAEGTAIKTLANLDERWHWTLVHFANQPNDQADVKNSPYENIRAQMYYQCAEWFREEAVMDVKEEEWREITQKQLTWTKGDRTKKSLKKIAQPKEEIRAELGSSPDIADAVVLTFSRKLTERRPENVLGAQSNQQPHIIPDDYDPYEAMEAEYRDL